MPLSSPLVSDIFPKKASAIASYYGFVPAAELFKRHRQQRRVRVALEPYIKRDPFVNDMHALLIACAERDAVRKSLPSFLYNINTDCGGHTFCEHPKKTVRFSLVALGMDKSIAEAMVLHTASAIFRDIGAETFRVYINSVGDRDSNAKFAREANTYLRRHINDMPVSLQTALRRDIFLALAYITEREHPLRDALPKTMQFLTDASRRHLREVLEYLESTEIPYAIDDSLIGHKDYYTQTLFEVRITDPDEKEEMTIARGGRFDEITRRYFRSTIPGAGIVIEGGTPRRIPAHKQPTKKPRVCVINIGLGAKRQSLPMIEMLRHARIPLHQALESDQLGEQLMTAESLGVPYALIIGQREALDGTVIVRNMTAQSQQTIPLASLPTHLRRIKL